MIVFNQSLVEKPPVRTDVTRVGVPANQIAAELQALISPLASAYLIMLSAGRSFTDPAGLLPSSFTRRVLLYFPGKRHVERKIIGQPTVLKAVNALRARYGKPPLIVAGDP